MLRLKENLLPVALILLVIFGFLAIMDWKTRADKKNKSPVQSQPLSGGEQDAKILQSQKDFENYLNASKKSVNNNLIPPISSQDSLEVKQ